MARLALGLSPCPNDTFIFHALLHGLVSVDYPESIDFDPFFADVQELNKLALAGELPFTKISAGCLPEILENYYILDAGSALGWGCGPLVIGRQTDINPETASIAIPGRHTTANMLLGLHGGFKGERREMVFSEIMPAVSRGEVDLGVIIHEGRFTYQTYGLTKLLDFGEWWEAAYNLPLPLGAIAARRDLPPTLIRAVQEAIAASILYARNRPSESSGFIKTYAQELEDEVIQSHIDTFVTDFSLSLAPQGKEAFTRLLDAAPANSAMRQNIFFED